MKYDEVLKIVSYLNERMRKITPWYKWSIKITWWKLKKWYDLLHKRKEAKP